MTTVGPANDFTFGAPSAGGDMFAARDHVGRLVAFVRPKLEEDVQTKFGAADAAKPRYTVILDGDDANTLFENSLIFGQALVPALTGSDAEIVLGRITVGEAKAGQSPPHILEAATEDDEKVAMAFFSQYAKRNAVGEIVIGG